MRVAGVLLVRGVAAWSRRRPRAARRRAEDAGGVEVAARRAGRDGAGRQEDRASGGLSRCARMARHDGPRRPGLSPGVPATGRFVVESELFLFPDSSDEGVGIFVSGQALGDQEPPAYTALLMRKDGAATVARRAGGSRKWRGLGHGRGRQSHSGKDAEKQRSASRPIRPR